MDVIFYTFNQEYVSSGATCLSADWNASQIAPLQNRHANIAPTFIEIAPINQCKEEINLIIKSRYVQ
jgi:hypothetical protein